MKALLTFLLIGSTLLTSTYAQNDESFYYSSRYDNIDVNNIFRSRLLNHYVDCLLDKKPCSPEGKDLKRVLPDALKTRCARCTKVQKEKALDVITRLYYQHPKLYTALAAKYDPTGEYTRNFEKWFDEQNDLKHRSISRHGQSSESDQQETRSAGGSGSQNSIPTELTRIPSTWITSTTARPTTPRRITTRSTLRTTQAPIRTTTQLVFREVAPPLPPSTVRTPPVFRQPPRTPPVTATVARNPEVRFDPPTAPSIIRDAPLSSQEPQAQIPSRRPEDRTRRPQINIESTNVRASPEFVQPSVILRDATTFRAPAATFTTTISRDQSVSWEPTAAVTIPPRIRTSSISPIETPQEFLSPPRQENEFQSLPRPESVDARRELPSVLRIASVPVRDSPTLPPQNNFQENARPTIYRDPTPAISPQELPQSRGQPPSGTQGDQTFQRDLELHGKRFEPVPPGNEPDLIDRFFIADGRFRKSVEQLMDRTGKVVGNVAEMLRTGLQAITKTK